MQRKPERTDDIGMGGFKVVQGDGFSYGIDAVLLSAFASGETGAKPVKSRLKMRVADLGTGNGIIPFILAHKLPISEIVGFERNPVALDRAVRGREMNALENRISFVLTDVSQLDGYDGFLTLLSPTHLTLGVVLGFQTKIVQSSLRGTRPRLESLNLQSVEVRF